MGKHNACMSHCVEWCSALVRDTLHLPTRTSPKRLLDPTGSKENCASSSSSRRAVVDSGGKSSTALREVVYTHLRRLVPWGIATAARTDFRGSARGHKQRGAHPKSDGSEIVCDTLPTHYRHMYATREGAVATSSKIALDLY